MTSSSTTAEHIEVSNTMTTPEQFFHYVPCPICRATDFTVIRPGTFPAELSESFLRDIYRSSSDHGLFEQVVMCALCDTVYLNPRLNPQLIIDSYAEGDDPSFIAQDEMRVRTFTKALRTLAKQERLSLRKETKILDIGCAGGAFLRAAQRLGVSAIGIEPNRWLGQYARETHGLDVRSGTLADHSFPDAHFDLITLWDVIEHVPDPTAELREIHRILKPNGILVINYPDHASLPARVLGKKWPFWLSVHLTYYTPTTIRKQLTTTGFKVRGIRPHWQTLELGYVLGRITPYFSLAQLPKRALERLGLHTMPITYWVGQTQVIARPKIVR